MVHIRKATVEDAEGILEHCKIVFSETKYLLTTQDEFQVSVEEEREWIENLILNNDLMFVAEIEGKIIGLLQLTKKKHQRVSHVGQFGISIQLAFCNQGIGKKMMAKMLDWVEKETSIEKIILEVFSNNERAIHLYKSFGFIEEGRKEKFIKYEDGTYTDEIIMSKWIKRSE